MARYVVDDQFGDLAHKDKSFADTVMFWRKDRSAPKVAAAAGSNQSAPIDPAAEDARLKALTGGQEVVIKRQGKSKIKLPGL
jgi:hypothetical protein